MEILCDVNAVNKKEIARILRKKTKAHGCHNRMSLLLEVRNGVLVPLRVFSLKRLTVRTLRFPGVFCRWLMTGAGAGKEGSFLRIAASNRVS